jgi:ribosomal protein S27AE
MVGEARGLCCTIQPVDCPSCGKAMTAETLDGHLGRPVAIDFCLPCQVFWFDQRESLQLAPAATLKLFRLIGEQAKAARGLLAAEPGCPRCGARLVATHDKQQNTPFEYLRCDREHGRLITFFNFLREKSFVRTLLPAQVEELRRNVQTVNCSNCGAPIDLAQSSTCGHCGSPLSMLDVDQAQRLIAQLREADRGGKPIDPALPLALAHARSQVEAAFAPFERDEHWYGEVSESGLVGAGLSALVRWLSKSTS